MTVLIHQSRKEKNSCPQPPNSEYVVLCTALTKVTATNLCNEGLCLLSGAVHAIFAILACRKAAMDCCHIRLFVQRSADSQRIVPSPL